MNQSAVTSGNQSIWLSVVIPAHDEGTLVRESVTSVVSAINAPQATLNATAEVLIVLDRASPETAAAAYSMEQLYSSVTVFNNSRAPGPAGARNTGIYAARGIWIAFLDADDRWRMEAPQALATCLGQYPDAQWVGGDFINVDNTGRQLSDTGELRSRPVTYQALQPAFESNEVLECRTPIAQFLNIVTCWTGATFVRKDTLIAAGAFNEHLRRAEDTNLWYRLALEINFYFIPKILTEYRQRESTLNRRGYSPGEADRQSLRDLMNREQFKPFRRLLRRRYCRSAVADCFFYRNAHQWDKGFGVVAEALRISPLNSQLWRQALALALHRA